MNFANLAGHLALLNFFVGASINIPSLKEVRYNNHTYHKFSWILFLLGSGCAFASLSGIFLMETFQLRDTSALILACMISALSLLGYFALKMQNLNIYTAPIIVLLLALYFLKPIFDHHTDVELFSRFFFNFHIAGALMGQFLAVCAGIIAVLFLWQQRLLKRKMLNLLTSKIPPQNVLENLLVVCLWSGFLFLSAALFSGAFYLWNFQGKIFIGEYKQKVIWALTVWVWYFLAILLRHTFKIPLKRFAQMSLMGLLILAITFFGLANI